MSFILFPVRHHNWLAGSRVHLRVPGGLAGSGSATVLPRAFSSSNASLNLTTLGRPASSPPLPVLLLGLPCTTTRPCMPTLCPAPCCAVLWGLVILGVLAATALCFWMRFGKWASFAVALVWFLNMLVMLGGVGECMLRRACCARLRCGSCACCVGGCAVAVPAPCHPHDW